MATLKITGEQKTFHAPDDTPLLWVLRDVLGTSPAPPYPRRGPPPHGEGFEIVK